MKNNYEFVYGQYIESQICHVVSIIDSLTTELAYNRPERYFLDSYLCLNLIVNIANVLDSKVKKERSQHLMKFFELSYDRISNILNHEMRNTNEHYDERLDDLLELSKIELKNTEIDNSQKLIKIMQVKGMVNFADIEKRILYSVNRKLDPIFLDLNVIKEEAIYIVSQIHKKIKEVKTNV